MFHYRITTNKRVQHDGSKTTTVRRVKYHEFLKRAHLGEHVASLMLGAPNKVLIERVTQATYLRGRKDTA